MTRKLAITAGALALTAGLAAPVAASPSDSSKPVNDGAYCVQQGIATLKSLGALQLAAKGQLNYAPLGSQPEGAGLINIEFTEQQVKDGVYLPLGTVVSMHASTPSLFDWCAR